jgi:hypothetical protein
MTAPAEESPVRYTYTGDGTAYLNDVPARDLTDEDLALLTEEQIGQVDASDLYEPVGARASTRRRRSADEPAQPEKE